MKYLSIVLLVLLSVLCFGCSNEDFDTGSIQGKYSFRLMTRTQNSETAFNYDLVGSLDAFLFKDGVLSGIYKDLTVTEDGNFTISSVAEGDRIYFLANTHGLLNEAALKVGLTETELLAMKMTSFSPQANGEKPVMTGKVDLPTVQSPPVVSLKRAIARIDLKIADGADIQINSMSMGNVCREAFLFAQKPVASPSDAKSAKIEMAFDDNPLKSGEHKGVVYLYEQAGDGIPVTVHGAVEGTPVSLSLTLPAAILRNTIYKMKVFSGANATLQATVSLVNEDWETGETVTAKPSAGLLVNSELSTLDGACLSATRDTVYLPSRESESVLVLDNIPEDANFTIDGVGTTVTIAPLAETRADIQGNRFIVKTSWKSLGVKKVEYMYLNMHSEVQEDHYTARLVFVRQPTASFEGELLNYLTNTPPYDVHYDKYIDAVLGRIEIPQQHEIAISGDNWLRLMPKGNRVYEIQAGYKPNDPDADGRIQECTLTVTDPHGLKEIYTFSRKNYGLPVVLMGDTYWCRFNLRGNSKKHEDQIQIKDAAEIMDDADYLRNCSNDKFIQILGSHYLGTRNEGFGIEYDERSSKFVLDNNGGQIVPDTEIAVGPATSHCPEGYQIPRDTDFQNIISNALLFRPETPTDYVTGDGSKATHISYPRSGVVCDNHTFGNVTYHKISIENGNSLVMAAMGYQETSGEVLNTSVYWAAITGEENTWFSSSRLFMGGQPVGKKFSRTVRCIKSKPAFIIEE